MTPAMVGLTFEFAKEDQLLGVTNMQLFVTFIKKLAEKLNKL